MSLCKSNHDREKKEQIKERKNKRKEKLRNVQSMSCGWYQHDGGGMYKNLELGMKSSEVW
jgi:hypothetical protein